MRGRNDIPFFFEFFCRVKPYDRQVEWLEGSSEASQSTLATGNRWGKSLIQSGKLLHHCIYKTRNKKWEDIENYIACNVSITLDQSRIIWNLAEKFTRYAELSWCLASPPTIKPFPIIKFGNGAELWARSTDRPKHLWGHVFDLINFDEPAYEKHPEEILPLLRTRLLDRDGQINFSGTPNGKGWYHQEFIRGLSDNEAYDPECYSQRGSTEENPFVSEKALERLYNKKYMSDAQIAQHLHGEFLDFSDAVFSEKAILNFLEPSMEMENYQEGHQYVTGWDVAEKVDFLVGITLDITELPFKVVDFIRLGREGWKTIYDCIRARHNHFNDSCYFDATGPGQHLEDELSDINGVPVTIGHKTGPNAIGKMDLIIQCVKMLEQGRIKTPFIKALLEELRFYRWDDKRLRTDCVMALAIAILGASIEAPHLFYSNFRSEEGSRPVTRLNTQATEIRESLGLERFRHARAG